MAAVPGVGARRAFAIKGALTDRLGHRHFKRPPHSPGPPIALLLDVDREYRSKAGQGHLRKIAQALQSGRSGLATRPPCKSRRMAVHRALFKHTKSA